VHLETRGYDFKQLALIDLEPKADKRKHRGKRVAYDTIHLDNKRDLKKRYSAIPNTMRGFSPAVSPDGQKVAFLQYRDGTLNLAVVNIDGTDKRLLTDFDDGTWMQHADCGRTSMPTGRRTGPSTSRPIPPASTTSSATTPRAGESTRSPT